MGKRTFEPQRALADKSPLAHFGAGVVAELGGALIWTPMDVIKQRQQAAQRAASYATVPGALRTILADAGPRGLFKGLGASLATYGPFVGLYFVIYEQWKRGVGALGARSGEELPFAAHLTGGAVAGAVAAYVTTPLDVIKTRLQTSTDAHGRAKFHSSLAAARHVLQHEGLRAFMKGASARVVWIAPGTAITIAAYEQAKRFFDHKFADL